MLRFTNIDKTPTQLPPVEGYQDHALLPLKDALEPVVHKIAELDRNIVIAKRECHSPSEHGLTHDESAAIYLYTLDWGIQCLFRTLNSLLNSDDRSVLKPYYGYLKLFDTALKKLPDQSLTLWRGSTSDIASHYTKNMELTWWKYTSWSSSRTMIQEFLGPGSTLMTAEAKHAKSIAKYSKSPEDHEFILRMGTRVSVTNDPTKESPPNVIKVVQLDKVGRNAPANPGQAEKDPSPPGKYQGDMQDGKKHGKGTYNNSDGSKYVGDWAHDEKSGHGVYTWPSGSKYDGEWKAGNMHGKGTKYYANGNKYVGDWANDQKTGHGVYTWPTGNRYEGEWKDGNMHGRGTYTYGDGNKYVGDWVSDQMTGHGVHTWANGTRHEGQWKNGQKMV